MSDETKMVGEAGGELPAAVWLAVAACLSAARAMERGEAETATDWSLRVKVAVANCAAAGETCARLLPAADLERLTGKAAATEPIGGSEAGR